MLGGVAGRPCSGEVAIGQPDADAVHENDHAEDGEADQHSGLRVGEDKGLGVGHCRDFSAATVFCLAA